MAFETLVTPDTLDASRERADWAVVDCRFSLEDVGRGEAEYEAAHIPGAVYAHLDRDLSSPSEPGRTGRHPLPDPDLLAGRLGAWGIGEGSQVVAYDDGGGQIAARLWWLLRWLGHDAVAVLDGGWARWTAERRPTSGETVTPLPRAFRARLRPALVVDADRVAAVAADPDWRVLDARSAERFAGTVEPHDTVAGHIPGAVNAPYASNLDSEGGFRPADDLRARFEAVLEGVPASRAVAYCGSGVTAAHNVLAIRHAGLGDARLYAGSWSEWITDPERPVATGA